MLCQPLPGTPPAQRATGALMRLKSDTDARLVSAASPVAGKEVELRPGGYHVMLMDLKAQVKEGDPVGGGRFLPRARRPDR